jgi:superfamily II DNA or RNA helicase
MRDVAHPVTPSNLIVGARIGWQAAAGSLLARVPGEGVPQTDAPEVVDHESGTLPAHSLGMRLRFDLGTLLLEDPPEGIDLCRLPGVVWDNRVGLFRAPGYRYRQLTCELTSRRIPFQDLIRQELAGPFRPASSGTAFSRPAPSRPASPEQFPVGPATAAEGAWAKVELRPYQAAALATWELADRRGLIVLPTGSGKTRLALAAMAAGADTAPETGTETGADTGARARAQTGPFRRGMRCLCLVPTRVLLTQWQAEIGRVYPGQVGIWGDGAREIAAVTVITFESAYRHMDRLGNQFDLLVIDEAHHFGLGPQDEALELSVAPYRLGLTATLPDHPDRRRRLEHLVGPVLYELAVGDLAGLFLAPFDLVTLTTPLTRTEQVAYLREVAGFRPFFRAFFGRSPGAGWEDLCREAGRCEAGRQAMAAWRRARRLVSFHAHKAEMVHLLLERHRANKVLVFTAGNEAAYTIARRELIMPITCDIGRPERRSALDHFAAGKLRALVSSQVLNEGIDVPDADVAVVVGGSGSEREHVQRIGRLLRPSPGKRAVIYELVTRGTSEVEQAVRRRGILTRRTGHLRPEWGSAESSAVNRGTPAP